MKHISASLVVLSFLVVAACSKLQEKPVVDFVMKNFSTSSSPDCKVTDSIPCASFEVQYPSFLTLDTAIRQSITERVCFIFYGPGSSKSFKELGDEFVRDFDSFLADMPGYELDWYFKGYVEVMVSTDTLISLRVDSESFTGGAHGTYNTSFVNIDPKTGTAYLLDAMLREGWKEELNRLAEEDLREQLGVTEADSVSGPDFEEGEFKLNDNYGFRKEGIVFFFNDYDKPVFAEGPTEILIPYEKLQDWIK
ncbi:MAG TPA: DUF3298 domain-containing protein [Cyclobacteriaceae bacterium]|nr:DUF3298 domain-containing protein [Cyclobacteriaceae bacterium]